MPEDFVFFTDEQTVKNLDTLASEQGIVEEQRILELADIADAALDASLELARSGFGAYEILSAVADGLDFGSMRVSDDALNDIVGSLGSYMASLGDLDRAVFCDLYARGAYERGLPLSERELLHTSDGEATFIYSRNAYADEAYDVFSQDFDDPRVRYGKSFADCVSAVTDGEVRFCLLPLEEKGGVRLPTVSELIYRSDLKINSVTPVFGFDGNADLKYALLSLDFTLPEANDDDDRYLEIRVGTHTAISTLFSALGFFGTSVYRINTLTFDTEGVETSYFSVVVRDGGRGFAALLIYLALFISDYTPVGIYKNLE